MTYLRSSAAFMALMMTTALAAATGALAQGSETLVVDNAFQLKTADPARQFEPTASLVLHPVYQTLVTFEGSDLTKVVPSLAEVPTISEDGKAFTFVLKDGATFSDGSPVTVDDVVFSLTRVRDLKGSPSFLMEGVTIAKGATENEVVLTTEMPDPGLPYKLTNPSLGILNSDVLLENGSTATPEDGADAYLASTSLGSGPYVITKFDMATEVVLTANENYWGEPPVFAQIVIRNVQSAAQQMNVARDASQIALDLRPDQVESIADQVNVLSAAGADLAFMFANMNPEISETTANADFREAVRYALDYEGILKIVGQGAVQPGSIIPSMFGGALTASQGPSRDLDRAREALARSGIENPTVGFSYSSDLTKNGVSFSDIAAKVQADLAEIGIIVEPRPAPVATNTDSYRKGVLEMSVNWWGPDFPDPSNYLLFGPGKLVGLRAGWAEGSAPDLDALGARAAVATDPAERAKLYEEWQMMLNDIGPFTGLFQPSITIASSKSLAPLAYNPMWTVDLSAVTLAAN